MQARLEKCEAYAGKALFSTATAPAQAVSGESGCLYQSTH
ncbi:hypothetical protein AABM17_666 [Neisseria musculi]|uniref:Uncharacterized protein n=1 Tax=Neisseria musculi TaxID=1815583 RepID=A0A7H1MCM1_9NEIS|nr:hypothetical protein H7A79_0666 [Neisseria musculi]